MFEKLETLYISQSRKCPSGCVYCFSSEKQEYTMEKLTKFWEWFNDRPNAKAFGFLGFDPVDFKTLIFLKQLDNPKNIKLRVDMNGCDFNNSVLNDVHVSFLDGLLKIPNIQLTIKVPTEELPLLKIVADLPKEDIIIKLIIRPDNFQNIEQELIGLVDDGFANIVLHIQEYNINKHPYKWENIAELHNSVVNAVTNIRTPFELTVDDVGHKGSTNCPAGENEISIDSDGNIYGCYVFANQNSESTILGNILTGEMNEFHVDHYKRLFEYSLATDPKCSSCDISNYCHRCPAGKYLTDGSLYGPTDACQDIVRMALKINSMLMIKTFILTYGGMIIKPVGNEMKQLVFKWIGKDGDLSDIYEWEKLDKDNLSLADLYDKIVVKYSLYQIRNISIPKGKEELFIIAIMMFILDYYDLPTLDKS